MELSTETIEIEGINTQKYKPDDRPTPKRYIEKIGDREWELFETRLDVFNEVGLWHANPRLLPYLAGGFESEEGLEASLRRTAGYQPLLKSIQQIGQMEPVYVWKRPEQPKYLVLEGATRVCILRELARRHEADPAKAGMFNKVRAKVLPADFGDIERVILLARIHVRGSGVRSWGRYIEAKFIYDNVMEVDGHAALMNATEMARHMGKSTSWVTRLRDAYEFARRFVEHIDAEDAEARAVKQFSVLEEIAKSKEIGPKLRDYDNPDYDGLRDDVFGMVNAGAFKEYRDARFMKEFYDDDEKWALLKSGEEGVASRLANEVKSKAGTLKAKIAGIEAQLQRAIEIDPESVDDDDLEQLRRAVSLVEGRLFPDVRAIRRELRAFTTTLEEASLADIRSIQDEELTKFDTAYQYIKEQRTRCIGGKI